MDLVKNEWLAGYQVVVARATLETGGIRVDASDPTWEEVLLRPFEGVDPDEQPEEFLNGLASHVNGTYLFATEPHDDSECPYQEMVVRLESTGEVHSPPQPV